MQNNIMFAHTDTKNTNRLKDFTIFYYFQEYHSRDFICDGILIQNSVNDAPWNCAMQDPHRVALKRGA